MLRQATRARRLVTLAGGISGVVVAHLVAYVLAYSDAGQRAHVLHDTGHGYFPLAIGLGAAAAALAVASVAARGTVRTAAATTNVSAVPGFSFLVLWQAVLFLAVETSERLAAGTPVSEMLHGREVLIGVFVQVAVAAAIVLVLRGTERLSAWVATVFRRNGAGRRRVAPERPTSAVRPLQLLAATTHSRAPPRPAVLQPLRTGR